MWQKNCHKILKLYNMRMESSNVRKKVKKPLNVIKKLLYMMLELYNMRIEPPNMRKIQPYILGGYLIPFRGRIAL